MTLHSELTARRIDGAVLKRTISTCEIQNPLAILAE